MHMTWTCMKLTHLDCQLSQQSSTPFISNAKCALSATFESPNRFWLNLLQAALCRPNSSKTVMAFCLMLRIAYYSRLVIVEVKSNVAKQCMQHTTSQPTKDVPSLDCLLNGMTLKGMQLFSSVVRTSDEPGGSSSDLRKIPNNHHRLILLYLSNAAWRMGSGVHHAERTPLPKLMHANTKTTMAIREGEGVGRRHPNVSRREHGVIWEWQQIRTPKVAISATQAPPWNLPC